MLATLGKEYSVWHIAVGGETSVNSASRLRWFLFLFCRRKTFHPQWKPIHYGLTCPTQEKSQPTLGCTGEISQRCYYSYYYYPRDVSLIHSALPNPSLCCFIDQSPFSFCRVSLFCYSLFCSLLFCFIYLSPLECNCCEKRN